MVVVTPGNSAMAPPGQSHNPSQAETPQWATLSGDLWSVKRALVWFVTVTISTGSVLAAADSSQLYPGQCESKLNLKKEVPHDPHILLTLIT